jgi:hypothetical protein
MRDDSSGTNVDDAPTLRWEDLTDDAPTLLRLDLTDDAPTLLRQDLADDASTLLVAHPLVGSAVGMVHVPGASESRNRRRPAASVLDESESASMPPDDAPTLLWVDIIARRARPNALFSAALIALLAVLVVVLVVVLIQAHG